MVSGLRVQVLSIVDHCVVTLAHAPPPSPLPPPPPQCSARAHADSKFEPGEDKFWTLEVDASWATAETHSVTFLSSIIIISSIILITVLITIIVVLLLIIVIHSPP
mmetsp:Transcript_45601/g.91287  ORF Transcript_45601/g.91287 Transcript_45601/m.91287 type:complete len:106 (+) Transcript_45601:204-521(+)